MVTLKAGIDARGATQGAATYKNAAGRMVDANSRYVKSQDKSTNAMGTGRTAAGGLAGTMQTLAASFSAAMILRDLTSVMIGFEKQMSELQSVTGSSGIQLELMEDQIRDLGATTKFSAQEAAEGMTFLARAGFNTQDAINALPDTLNLAAAGALELGEAADIASNVLQAFNIAASDTTRVVDVLLTTANNANTNVQQLGEAFAYVGPLAGALKIPIEDTAAALGALGNAGIQGSAAGTNLRGIFTRLLDPTTKAQKALKDLGITLEQVDLTAKGNSLSKIFTLFAESGLEANQALAIFGRLNVAAALSLTVQAEAMETLTQKNIAAKGAAEEAARVMSDNLGGALKGLRSAVEELYLQIGESGLGGGLRELVDGATLLVRALGGNKEAADQLSPSLELVVVTTKLIAGAVSFLVSIIGTGFSRLGELFDLIADSLGDTGSMFKSSLKALANGTITVSDVVDGLMATFKKVGAVFEVYFVDPISGAIEGQIKMWKGLYSFIKQGIKSPLSAVIMSIGFFANSVIDLLRGLIERLAYLASFISSDVADSMEELSKSLGGVQQEISASAEYLAGDAAPKMKQALNDIKEGALEAGAALTPDLAKLDAANAKLVVMASAIDQELRDKVNARVAEEVKKETEKAAAIAELGKATTEQAKAEADAKAALEVVDASVKQLEDNQKFLDGMREGFKSEMVLLEEQYLEREELLNSLKDGEFANEKERQELLTKLTSEYEKKRGAITKKQEEDNYRLKLTMFQGQLGAALQFTQSMQLLLTAAGEKNMAESKAFGIAQAVISTAIGVARAMELGPWAQAGGIAFAIANGAAQIAAITSASKGSGSPPSSPGSGDTAGGDVPTSIGEAVSIDDAQSEQAQAPADVTATINIEGITSTDLVPAGQLTENIGSIIDTYVENGGRIRSLNIAYGDN